MKRIISLLSMAVLLLTMATICPAVAVAETDLVNVWDRDALAAYLGVINTNTGAVNKNGSAYYTNETFIEVNEGDVLTFGPNKTTQGYQLGLYDAAGTFVMKIDEETSGVTYTAVDTSSSIFTFTVPAGVGKIRASVATAYADRYLFTINQNFDFAAYNAYWAAQDAEALPEGTFDDSAAADEFLLTNSYNKSKVTEYTDKLGDGYHFTSASYNVAVGDVFYFGPASSADAALLSVTPTGASAVNVAPASCKVYDTLTNGDHIYAYQLTTAGKMTFRVAADYNDLFIVSKNNKMTAEKFYYFWDHDPKAYNINLYRALLDPKGVLVNADGSYTANLAFNSTHAVAVEEGETLFFGPVFSGESSYGVAYKDGVGTPITQGELTVKTAMGSNAVFYSYTVPAEVDQVQMILPTIYEQCYYLTREGADIEAYRNNLLFDYYLDAESNLYSAGGFAASAGDSLYFGPVKDFSALGLKIGGTAVDAGACAVVDTLPDGSALMVCPVTADATVTMSPESAYASVFSATLNCPMAQHNYYVYWDSQTESNLHHPADLTTETHRVPVNQGETITLGPVAENVVSYGTLYDAKGAEAGKITFDALDPVEEQAGYYQYAVPDGIFYVTLNVEDASTFKAYYYYDMSVLEGKTALFVGDSICFGHHDYIDGTKVAKSWAVRIAEAYGLVADKRGKNSASISTARKDNYIVTQLESAIGNTYDYVVIQGGTNDGWLTAPVGKISKSFAPDSFDRSTFAGGLEHTFYTAVQNFGKESAIAYILTFQMPYCSANTVRNMAPYYEVALEICEKWNIPYINMHDSKKINAALRMDAFARGTNGHDFLHSDYCHPRAAGYDRLYNYVANYMVNMKPYGALHDGDVNQDTKTNLMDVMIALRLLNGKTVNGNLDYACLFANGDSVADIGDAVMLLRKAAGWDVELLGPPAHATIIEEAGLIRFSIFSE